MPWNIAQYPNNWEELARAWKERANWTCEHCGAVQGAEQQGKRERAYPVRLAAAHLHHDPANPEPQLVALCQKCHLRHDRFHHGTHARQTRHRHIREAMIAAGQLWPSTVSTCPEE